MLHFDLRRNEAVAALREILGEEPPPEARRSVLAAFGYVYLLFGTLYQQ